MMPKKSDSIRIIFYHNDQMNLTRFVFRLQEIFH